MNTSPICHIMSLIPQGSSVAGLHAYLDVSMSGPCNWILGHQCIPHLLACCGHHKLLQHRHDAVIVLHEILQVVDANSTFPGASLPRSYFMIFLCPSSVICWYDWSAWPLPAFSMTPAITAIEVMASSLTWFLKKWKRCSSLSVKNTIYLLREVLDAP